MGTKYALLVSVAAVLLAVSSCGQRQGEPRQGVAEGTELVLWAWHGGHDLRFLAKRSSEQRTVSVAYLARRLVVGESGTEAQLRSSPLELAEDTQRTAVVRIELAPQLSMEALRRALPDLLAHLEMAAGEPSVSALQLDFDAPARLRPAYRALLREARSVLYTGQQLEMTALASWCMDDAWVEDGLVDAVVPMLFEMGPTGAAIRKRLHAMPEFPAARCRGNIGVSTTDVMPPLGRKNRVFIFAPGRWTKARLARVEQGLGLGMWVNARQKNSTLNGETKSSR